MLERATDTGAACGRSNEGQRIELEDSPEFQLTPLEQTIIAFSLKPPTPQLTVSREMGLLQAGASAGAVQPPCGGAGLWRPSEDHHATGWCVLSEKIGLCLGCCCVLPTHMANT